MINKNTEQNKKQTTPREILANILQEKRNETGYNFDSKTKEV